MCCHTLVLIATASLVSAETTDVSSTTVAPVTPPVVSTTVIPSAAPALLTLLHPTEGQKLPPLTQIFTFGQVTPGSTLTINGATVPVHPKGGYLAMVPLVPGDNLLKADVVTPMGGTSTIERHVSVSAGFVVSRSTPVVIERWSVSPGEDQTVIEGDLVRVTFQGSPGGQAEFAIPELIKRVPMVEVNGGSSTARGLYQGSYIVRPGDEISRASIVVSLKKGDRTARERSAGLLTIDRAPSPRMGIVIDDVVAVRTAPEGGYDLFLYKGMKVRLTGKSGSQRRVRLSSMQSGWVKDSAVQELPAGTLPVQSTLGTISTARQSESTVVRTTFSDLLPYRVEQSINPMQLIVTVFGASAKTDLMKFDPSDSLIRQVRWRQLSPDAAQITIEPTFKTWWGYDVRYEGTTLIVEVREPWKTTDIKGMSIAIDPGHGGSDGGAMGPLGTLEKNTNLAIAKVVQETLVNAGARAFLLRGIDTDVALAERGKTAWKAGARLFVSVHGNSSGPWENPVWNNGYSVYFYQPQSKALAEAVHAQYRQQLSPLADHGLYYADLAVCRTTQMPAILTEQAYLIVPEQEQLLLDPKFHKSIALAVLNGIRDFLRAKP